MGVYDQTNLCFMVGKYKHCFLSLPSLNDNYSFPDLYVDQSMQSLPPWKTKIKQFFFFQFSSYKLEGQQACCHLSQTGRNCIILHSFCTSTIKVQPQLVS